MRYEGTLDLLVEFLGRHLARGDLGTSKGLDELPVVQTGDFRPLPLRHPPFAVPFDGRRQPELAGELLGVPVKGVKQLSGNSIVKVPAAFDVLITSSSTARFFATSEDTRTAAEVVPPRPPTGGAPSLQALSRQPGAVWAVKGRMRVGACNSCRAVE